MSYMANIYADLIRKGEKTIDQVPGVLKKEVEQLLGNTREQDID